MNENTDRLSDEAFAQQIMQGARTIQPDATFASELEQTLLQSAPRHKSRPSPQRIIRLMGTTAAALALTIIITFNVPSLRAIAEEIIGLLIRSDDDKTTTFYTGQQFLNQMFKSVEEAEAALSRDFAAPQYLPSAMIANNKVTVYFRYFTYYPERSSAMIEYGFRMDRAWSMTLSQMPSETYFKEGGLHVGQSAEIETVTFNFRGNPVSGQFVDGGWLFTPHAEIPYPDIPATPIPIDVEWSQSDKTALLLTWEDEGVVYRLFANKNPYFKNLRDELIRIAESIE